MPYTGQYFPLCSSGVTEKAVVWRTCQMAHAKLSSIINLQRLGLSPSHGWWVLQYPPPPIPASLLHAALHAFYCILTITVKT